MRDIEHGKRRAGMPNRHTPELGQLMDDMCCVGELLVLAFVRPVDGDPFWTCWTESHAPGEHDVARTPEDAIHGRWVDDEAGS